MTDSKRSNCLVVEWASPALSGFEAAWEAVLEVCLAKLLCVICECSKEQLSNRRDQSGVNDSMWLPEFAWAAGAEGVKHFYVLLVGVGRADVEVELSSG